MTNHTDESVQKLVEALKMAIESFDEWLDESEYDSGHHAEWQKASSDRFQLKQVLADFEKSQTADKSHFHDRIKELEAQLERLKKVEQDHLEDWKRIQDAERKLEELEKTKSVQGDDDQVRDEMAERHYWSIDCTCASEPDGNCWYHLSDPEKARGSFISGWNAHRDLHAQKVQRLVDDDWDLVSGKPFNNETEG